MESLMTMLEQPAELLAIARLKFNSFLPENKPEEELSDELIRCQQLLRLTGRTFAAVILSLEPVIREPLTVLYLTLRALDTVEDDLHLASEVRIRMLREFHEHLLEPEWSFNGSKDKDAVLLREFPTISSQYRELKESYRNIISDVCLDMGYGMSNQLNKPIITMQQYDQYCNYASGIVYLAANRMFVASGLEPATLTSAEQICCHLGLFLQKCNIIRDYLDDVTIGRYYWPKEVWSKYVSRLEDLSERENEKLSVQCLNELITNSLLHIPYVIEYLSQLTNQSVFKSCALPMVMAIATLERCYGNPQVFRGVVKIRKGEAVRLMMGVNDINDVRDTFCRYLNKIKSRVPQSLSQGTCTAVAAGALIAVSAAAPSATPAVVDCCTIKIIQRLLSICSNHGYSHYSNSSYNHQGDRKSETSCHNNSENIKTVQVIESDANCSRSFGRSSSVASSIRLSNEKDSDGSSVLSISWRSKGEESLLSLSLKDSESMLMFLYIVWRLYLVIICTITSTSLP